MTNRRLFVCLQWLAAVVVLSTTTLPRPAFAVTVLPGQGVSISQVSFNSPSNPFPDSPTGVASADQSTLLAATGMASGYINVASSLGWVVQNLPIFSGSTYPGISTAFDLGSSGPISSIPLLVDYSPTPLTTFSGPPSTSYPVSPTNFSGEGKDNPPLAGPPAPPPVSVMQFDPAGVFNLCCEPGHGNIEAASNQCGPAACANSLCWLQGVYPGIVLPDNCGMGLGNDGTVVGKLDGTMTRAFTSRRSGSPVSDSNFLKGKLTYLSNGNLGLTADFMATLDGNPPAGNFTAAGRVATRHPGNPSATFMFSEICNGEDVELGYTNPKPPGGGHWVQVLCAGTVLGQPFVVHSSDQDQGSDTKGTSGTQFGWLKDTDGDGQLNLVGEPNTPNVDIVVAESPGKPVRTTQTTWGAVKAHYR